MRFCRQTNLYTCGPIALLNALKWGGADATYRRHMRHLKRECKTDADGTHDFFFDRALRNNGKKFFSVIRPRQFNLQTIREHIKNGGSIIVAHIELKPPYDWHYSFWCGVNEMGGEDLYFGVNVEWGFTHSLLDSATMKTILTKSQGGDHPIVWLLSPN